MRFPSAVPAQRLETVRSGTGAAGQSVDCHTGEIHALVGENGSGKSTLLGIASGFVHPDEGAVEIGGAGGGADRPPRPEAGSRDGVSDLLACPRPVGGGEPLSRRAEGREQVSDPWRTGRQEARETSSRARWRFPRARCRWRERQRLEVIEGVGPAEGLAPRRADDGARARGGSQVRRLVADAAGRLGDGDRQPVRPRPHGHGRRRSARSGGRSAASRPRKQRHDADRRGDQPGQLGRAAAERPRRGDRHQHGDLHRRAALRRTSASASPCRSTRCASCCRSCAPARSSRGRIGVQVSREPSRRKPPGVRPAEHERRA